MQEPLSLVAIKAEHADWHRCGPDGLDVAGGSCLTFRLVEIAMGKIEEAERRGAVEALQKAAGICNMKPGPAYRWLIALAAAIKNGEVIL